MNRIILIGNGFDRSLGLATSYSHFLDWIFNDALEHLSKAKPDTKTGWVEFSIDNELLSLTANNTVLLTYKSNIDSIKTYSEWREIFSTRVTKGARFEIGFRDDFVKKLFDNYEKDKWVDIEQLYFDSLLSISDTEILDLNETFNQVKLHLIEYLGSLDINSQRLKEVYKDYHKHFFAPRVAYNLNLRIWKKTAEIPKSVYFVNFNYTSTLSVLLEQGPRHLKDNDVQNSIHGNLFDSNKIIFGYGNESGDEYLSLEKRSNQFLQNIKSNNYFQSTHYKDLLMNLGVKFEVYIYGLSCGLSDHILLKTITEHPNCFQIRIFYKKEENGDDNHKETVINLSRAFTDKANMRSKIISKLPDDFIPQFEI